MFVEYTKHTMYTHIFLYILTLVLIINYTTVLNEYLYINISFFLLLFFIF